MTLGDLKKAYEANKHKDSVFGTFEVEGITFVVGYAKYFIESLEHKGCNDETKIVLKQQYLT